MLKTGKWARLSGMKLNKGSMWRKQRWLPKRELLCLTVGLRVASLQKKPKRELWLCSPCQCVLRKYGMHFYVFYPFYILIQGNKLRDVIITCEILLSCLCYHVILVCSFLSKGSFNFSSIIYRFLVYVKNQWCIWFHQTF